MNTDNRPVRFMLAWLVAGITALPTALVLSVTAIVSLQTALEELLDSSHIEIWENYGPLLMGIALLIMGFCIGTLQKGVIRRRLGIEIRRLCLYSVFGSMLAGIIGIMLAEMDCPVACKHKYDLLPTIWSALIIGAYLGIFSSIQAMALRRYFRMTGLWVAAHLGAVALTGAIVLPGRLAFPTRYDQVGAHLLIGIPIVALFTGMAMRYLVDHELRIDEVTRGDHCARPSAGQSPNKPSVWDDAL